MATKRSILLWPLHGASIGSKVLSMFYRSESRFNASTVCTIVPLLPSIQREIYSPATSSAKNLNFVSGARNVMTSGARFNTCGRKWDKLGSLKNQDG